MLDILRSGIDETLIRLGRDSVHDLVPADLLIGRDFAVPGHHQDLTPSARA